MPSHQMFIYFKHNYYVIFCLMQDISNCMLLFLKSELKSTFHKRDIHSGQYITWLLNFLILEVQNIYDCVLPLLVYSLQRKTLNFFYSDLCGQIKNTTCTLCPIQARTLNIKCFILVILQPSRRYSGT